MNKKNYYIMAIVSLSIFICNLDSSIVNITLPTLSKVFHVSTSMVSRIALVDLLAVTSFILIFGGLGDIKGLGNIFRWGFVITTFSSLLCGLSPDINVLLVFRFIHGIGEAMLLSTYGAIIVRFLPSEIRGRAFSFTTVIGGIALALGSPLGGLFLEYLDWRWIFFLKFPFGILGFLLSVKFLQDESNGEKIENSPFDIMGAIFSFFGLFTLLYALNMGDEYGWKSIITMMSFVFSIIFLVIFIMWEKKQKTPLVDFSIFKNLYFTAALTGDLVVLMTLEGTNFLFPFYFDFVKGYSTSKIGFLMMIYPVMSMIISPLSGYLSDKTGKPKIICNISLLFVIISCGAFCLFNLDTGIIFIIFAFILFGGAVNFFFTANTCFEMTQVSQSQEGITSAIISFTSNLASVIGICLFETIYSFNFGYHTPGKTHLALHKNIHIAGFHDACFFAFLLCTAGFFVFLLVKEKKPEKRHNFRTTGIIGRKTVIFERNS